MRTPRTKRVYEYGRKRPSSKKKNIKSLVGHLAFMSLQKGGENGHKSWEGVDDH